MAERVDAAWREHRAFERAQWQEVVLNRKAGPGQKPAHQWVEIDQDRALAVAIAAVGKGTLPQGRK